MNKHPPLALIAVAHCASSARLDAWSRMLCALALMAVIPSPHPAWPLLAVAAGLLQLFFALRLGFDRPVFENWAACPENASREALAAFDAALAQTGLRRQAGERDLAQRLGGLRSLFRRQLLAFAVQLAAMLGTVVTLILR